MIMYSLLIKHLRFPDGEKGDVFVLPCIASDAVPCDCVRASADISWLRCKAQAFQIRPCVLKFV